MKNVKETLEMYADYFKSSLDESSSKNFIEALDELDNFKRFNVAIINGNKDKEINNEHFRIQVAAWADENLKRLEALGI